MIKQDTKRVFLKTYGCQMNEYDTELIRSILQKANYCFADCEGDANIILLNTCSVRDMANRKVYGHIHSIRHQQKDKPILIGVLGCMATDQGKDLLDNPRLKIDFIVGPDSYKKLPQIIEQAKQAKEKPFDIVLSELETYADCTPSRIEGVNAWVAVMRGCDNFCSFCIVPYVRGRERSRSPENILKEVRQLAIEGFRQVTLLGQNVNSYRYDNKDFAFLLEEVSKIDEIERIRFMSPHPKDFPQRLIEVVAANKKVCKHIHLPLQAGNDRILQLMNRGYTQAEYLHLVDQIRSASANITLTTDIIVGFPMETEDEFNDTKAVMEKVKFDSAFIFKYSPRKKTLAHKKYSDNVPAQEKTRRIVLLNELQKRISFEKNQSFIGREAKALIEQQETKKGTHDFHGRTDDNKIVVFPAGPYKIGQFVNVKIDAATPHVLKGHVVSANAHQSTPCPIH